MRKGVFFSTGALGISMSPSKFNMIFSTGVLGIGASPSRFSTMGFMELLLVKETGVDVY